MKNKKTNNSIKYWSEQDQPREKMLQHGRQILSDAELVAILLGSGSTDESALSLSHRILESVDRDLQALGRVSLGDLMTFKGIGEAKAVTIAAALELGRRRQDTAVKDKLRIQNSQDAYRIMSPLLSDLEVEQFWIILLNRAHDVIGKRKISEGGVAGTVVDAKVVFKTAIDFLASSIVLVHNHPSGNLNPSQQDRTLTTNLVEAGKVLNVKVIDHLIISEKGYTSFADEGWI